MIYIVFAIICLAVWICFIKEECMDFGFVGGIVLSFLTLIVTAMVFAGLSLGSLGLATLFADSSYKKTNDVVIISIQDSSIISGKFFLGSGSINGAMIYTYMSKNENGEMAMNQLNVSDATLVYSLTPKAEEYEKFFDSKVVKFLFGKQPFYSSKYKLYIPEGTIKENYNVDLQ